MTQLLAALSLIVQMLPLIRQLVATLDEMFPDSGNGAGKKAIVTAVIDGAVAGSEQLQAIVQAAQPALSIVIDAVVALQKKKAAQRDLQNSPDKSN